MTAAAVTLRAVIQLGIARQAPADEGTQRVYLDSLRDLDADVVRRACLSLGLEPKADYEPALPSVGLIRERCKVIAIADIETAATAKLLPAPAFNPHEPTFFCADCLDEPHGWRIFQCRGVGAAVIFPTAYPVFPCARKQEHPSHTYAEKCKCADVNPMAKQARDRMAAARSKPKSAGVAARASGERP